MYARRGFSWTKLRFVLFCTYRGFIRIDSRVNQAHTQTTYIISSWVPQWVLWFLIPEILRFNIYVIFNCYVFCGQPNRENLGQVAGKLVKSPIQSIVSYSYYRKLTACQVPTIIPALLVNRRTFWLAFLSWSARRWRRST